MTEIKLLNKSLLIEFINHEDYNTLESIPITRHRAISQILNPRLEDNDVLLLLAYQEEKIVGYLGVLPDQIFINNKTEKCGWLSCLWVNPSHRGKQIAQLLLDTCFDAWGKRILATEFTPSAKRLYDKSNFFKDLQIKEGIRLYIRSDLHNLLPPRKRIFKKLFLILKVTDAIINSLLDIKLLFRKPNIGNLRLEYINHLDNEVQNFISDKQQNQLFKRGKTELNWIIKNPWVLSTPIMDVVSSKYHFSSSDKSFNFYALKVRNSDNQLIAFIIFSKRNQNLKLPYCYYHGDHLNSVINILYFHLLKWKIKTFTTFKSEITRYLSNNKTPALFKREIKRHYIISNFFSTSIFEEEYEIEDGDADCSFT